MPVIIYLLLLSCFCKKKF